MEPAQEQTRSITACRRDAYGLLQESPARNKVKERRAETEQLGFCPIQSMKSCRFVLTSSTPEPDFTPQLRFPLLEKRKPANVPNLNTIKPKIVLLLGVF